MQYQRRHINYVTFYDVYIILFTQSVNFIYNFIYNIILFFFSRY